MPGAAVLTGVKGPRVGPGSVMVGHGNQRVWMSGVGVWSRRTLAITSPRREIYHVKTPHFAAEVHRLVIGSAVEGKELADRTPPAPR